MARKKRKTTRRPNRGRGKELPLRPMKIAALIISAIQELRETKGTTPNQIADFINYASNMSENRVKRQVKSALKKGVEYGILKRYRGQYYLPTGDNLDRANRAAIRFSTLPLPVPATATKPKRIATLRNRARARRNSGKQRISRPRPLRVSPERVLEDPVTAVHAN